jgi:hypothetical protein
MRNHKRRKMMKNSQTFLCAWWLALNPVSFLPAENGPLPLSRLARVDNELKLHEPGDLQLFVTRYYVVAALHQG